MRTKVSITYNTRIPVGRVEALCMVLGIDVKDLKCAKDKEIVDSNKVENGCWIYEGFTTFVAEVNDLIKLGIPFEVSSEPYEPTFATMMWDEIRAIREAVETKLHKMELSGTGGDAEQIYSQQFNSRINVHVPGLGLLVIDEVCVETDCCTDRLNNFLEEGWRILCVCPQPDQRRPDYVLGRTKKAN